MNQRIFGRFKESKKWDDYYNFKSLECRISLIVAILTLFTFDYLGVYNKFDIFVVSLQNITIYIAQALIGMLGIIFAGIAIVISLLNKKLLNSIKKINNKGIESILISFEFLTFNIGCGIILFIFINLILHNQKEMLPISFFYIIIFFISYFFAFIIFYTISLTGNCIRVFYINNLYTNISHKEKNIYDTSNEIRIDYLLYHFHKNSKMTPKELLDDLNNFVDESNVSNKAAVKKYFKHYYANDE